MAQVTLRQMAALLKEQGPYRIVYHIRPDGDCIGSAYALAMALQSIGKACAVAGDYPVPGPYLPFAEKLREDSPESPLNIAVDASSPDRLGSFGALPFAFCIDHHLHNSVPAKYTYAEDTAGACSEIILKLIEEMGVTVTKEMADLLFLALVTDTMCFCTDDTTQQSFQTAAALAGYGADIVGIARKTMFLRSRQRLALEEKLQNSFHYTCGGLVLTGLITLQDLAEADIQDCELEGINSFIDRVEEVLIGVTIRELPDGTTRCSFRTKGRLSADEICRSLGGGGHFHAAACVLPVPVREARAVIEPICEDYLRQHGTV